MYNSYNFKKIPLRYRLIGISCIIISFWGIPYLINIGTHWNENVLSVPTFLIEIAKILFFIICGYVGIIQAYYLVKTLILHIPTLFTALKEVPDKIRFEIGLIKNIMNNSGMGKYRLFGGIGFYFRLRMRVFAFLFALLFFSSTFLFLYNKYDQFETSHWVEKVYHHSKVKTFTFKKDIPYTICIHGSEVDYIFVNGYYFCGKDSPYKEYPNAVPLNQFRPHDTFSITFPEETSFAIKLKTEMVINDIMSEKYEIWENKADGYVYHYTVFDHRMYQNNNFKQENSKQKKNK